MKNILIWVGILMIIGSCKKDPVVGDPYAYDPSPYILKIPTNLGWSSFPIPADNPLTNAGVELGKKLFFDPILSANNTQSCNSCHLQSNSFADPNKFSIGAFGDVGVRAAMPLFNLGWTDKYNFTPHHYFWDGGANDLERQAIGPIMNPIEMSNKSLFDVVARLQNHSEYPSLFRKAFGSDSITSIKLAKAIAQYERTLISSNSNWDKAERRERLRTQSEINGMIIFGTEKGDCFHCHGNLSSPFFTDFNFHNNGLDAIPKDSGLYRITGIPADIGRFKTPSLRNLSFTGPYMHDGRFSNLMEVINFYDSGTKNSPTVDPMISKNFDKGGLNLTPQDKIDLLNFLLSLNDTSFVTNPYFGFP
ncbi:MAG: cytochrome-c peroxidase [Bacteroidia bacterium]|nr:cytochrome-c peroxidase [Bacteroidia bacterium]MCF8446809.1 cytochrome-c peroxidase [Bacteroidia bacterium]